MHCYTYLFALLRVTNDAILLFTLPLKVRPGDYLAVLSTISPIKASTSKSSTISVGKRTYIPNDEYPTTWISVDVAPLVAFRLKKATVFEVSTNHKPVLLVLT